MDLDAFLSTISPSERNSPAVAALIALNNTLLLQLQTLTQQNQALTQQNQTLIQELQKTQEDLTKAKERIKCLEDEIARLRKTPKRPKMNPNSMEPRDRSKPGKDGSGAAGWTGISPQAQREISEIKVRVENPPKGSRFKGYQPFTVQEISLVVKEITYQLEVWQAPDGQVIRAKLPEEIQGQHYGPDLRAFSTALYAHGVTQPAMYELLTGLGVEISSGKVNDILLAEAEGYATVSQEILSAGLQEAPFVRVDDTGAKHGKKAYYCTHIGGDFSAHYTTTPSKSRENFLNLLLQGKQGYKINEAAIWHLFQSGVEDDILNRLDEYKGKLYQSPRGFNRLLTWLGLHGKKIRRQYHEAAIVGFISESILRPGQVLLSDRAGQFALFTHAACWVHMERPLRKIVCSSKQVEQELTRVRNAIWSTYQALKEIAARQGDKVVVHSLYDQLMAMKTASPEINAVIQNFSDYREELLRVLDHPGLLPVAITFAPLSCMARALPASQILNRIKGLPLTCRFFSKLARSI